MLSLSDLIKLKSAKMLNESFKSSKISKWWNDFHKYIFKDEFASEYVFKEKYSKIFAEAIMGDLMRYNNIDDSDWSYISTMATSDPEQARKKIETILFAWFSDPENLEKMQEMNKEVVEKAVRECIKKNDTYLNSMRTDEETEFKAAFFERTKEKTEATFNLSEITDDDITRATDRDLKVNSDTPKIFTDPYGRIVGVANTQYLRMCLDLNAGDTYRVPVYIKDGIPVAFTKKDMKCIL